MCFLKMSVKEDQMNDAGSQCLLTVQCMCFLYQAELKSIKKPGISLHSLLMTCLRLKE